MPFPDFTPTVPTLLRTAAARFGTRTYLVVDGERLTYAGVQTRSAAVARGLLAEGIGKGSRGAIVVAGARAGIGDAFLAHVEDSVLPADPVVIVYSSGSAAEPKGAIHTQGTVVRHSCNLQSGYPMGPEDVMFSSMPFFWIGGLITTLFAPLHLGATLVTLSAFDAGAALDPIERERATIATGWPQQGKTMAEHPSYAERDLSSVVRTSMPDLVPAERRPPAINSTSLGMTEMCSSHTLWDQHDPLPESRRGTFGKSLPGITHKVVDPGTCAEVPAGDDGELWVRGYALMQGLHRREREAVFEPDGCYRTGDVLRARLEGELCAYKVPAHLWVCSKSELPFLPSGKIKKQELAELLATRFTS